MTIFNRPGYSANGSNPSSLLAFLLNHKLKLPGCVFDQEICLLLINVKCGSNWPTFIQTSKHLNNNKTLYVPSRKELRDWLSDNFDKTTEIWLVYPKKGTGKPQKYLFTA